jgi:hypothetical protein
MEKIFWDYKFVRDHWRYIKDQHSVVSREGALEGYTFWRF